MEEIKMNIYEKIQTIKVGLQDIKKTGLNSFTGVAYLQLKDFMPKVNALFLEHRLHSRVMFKQKETILIITNIDNTDEKLTYNSLNADVVVKGANGMQNMGALQTYQRRYLYMNALDIAESEDLDDGAPTKKEDALLVSSTTLEAIEKILKNDATRKKDVLEFYEVSKLSQLSVVQGEQCYRSLSNNNGGKS